MGDGDDEIDDFDTDYEKMHFARAKVYYSMWDMMNEGLFDADFIETREEVTDYIIIDKEIVAKELDIDYSKSKK